MAEDKAVAQKQQAPDPQQLQKSIAASQKVVAAQNAASSLKEKAQIAVDPIQRKKYLQEAYQKEVEAHGDSKLAKRLQSGPWQGAGAGSRHWRRSCDGTRHHRRNFGHGCCCYSDRPCWRACGALG